MAALRSRAMREDFPVHHHKSSMGNESTLICLRKGPMVSETQHHTVPPSIAPPAAPWAACIGQAAALRP